VDDVRCFTQIFFKFQSKYENKEPINHAHKKI
jgi:hypothetical protein